MVLWKKQFITVRTVLLKSQNSAMESPAMTMASAFTAPRTPTWPKSGVLASTTMAALTSIKRCPSGVCMEPISQGPEGIMESTGSFKVRISFSDIGLLSEELSWYIIQSYTPGRLVIEKISL